MKFIYAFAIIFGFITSSFALTGAEEALIEASKKGDLEGVKTAVTNGANIKAADADGNMALNHAFFWPEITKYLIEHGADPNEGTTPPLIPACSHYSTDVITILLGAGADPNKVGKIIYDPGAEIRAKIEAEKAKGMGASKGNIAQWERMLTTMKPSLVDAKALDVTVRQTNCAPCVDMLIAKGATNRPRNDYGQGTFIHTFITFGMGPEERSKLLKDEVGSLEGLGYMAPDWLTNIPADRNVSETKMIASLVSAGVDINGANARGQTALHQSMNGEIGVKVNMVRALVDNGADMSKEDPVYGPPLIMSLKSGDVDLMKYMVSKGADISMETKEVDKATGRELDKMTPIMIATLYDKFDLVKYLRSQGAGYTPGAEGKSYLGPRKCLAPVRNKNAIYFAIDNGNIEMVRWYAQGSKMGRPPTIIEFTTEGADAACFAPGKYKPSSYARAMGKDDIYKFLKVKGW